MDPHLHAHRGTISIEDKNCKYLYCTGGLHRVGPMYLYLYFTGPGPGTRTGTYLLELLPTLDY